MTAWFGAGDVVLRMKGIYSEDTYLTLGSMWFSSCAIADRGRRQCVVVDLSACNVIDCWWREMRSLRCRVDSNRNEDKMLVGYGREVWSALHEPASQLNCGDDQRWYLFSHNYNSTRLAVKTKYSF